MANIKNYLRSFLDSGTKYIKCLQCGELFTHRHFFDESEEISLTDICTHAATSHPQESDFSFQIVKLYKTKAPKYSSVTNTHIPLML